MLQNQAKWNEAHTRSRIVFVSGKGGVGKSLVAAAIARDQVKAGRKTLLVEIGDNSYYKDFWNLPSLGHDPIPHAEGFDIAIWSGESCLREYVLYYLRMEKLYRLFFENKVMRALIGVAPGLSEIAILGKITSNVRKVGPPMEYDVVVVDCYATGHALALLLAPKGMKEAIKFGPMGSHSRDMDAVIRNPAICTYTLVTLLEEMPVVETLEFRETLKRELGVESHIVANKVLEAPLERTGLAAIADKESKGLGEFAKFLGAVLDRQKSFLAALKQVVAEVPLVPLIFSADPRVLVKEAGEALRRA